MYFISLYKNKTLLRLYICPGAHKNEITGLYGDPARLKIKIKARPVDGEANTEIISFLSKLLGMAKNKIEMIKGETSRQKDFLIDLSLEETMKCSESRRLSNL